MIADRTERHRYELDQDGRLAGEIVYRLHGAETIELVHTEVKPEFEGQGLASQLAKFGLDDARRRGLKVIPTCTYIQRYIEKHAEYGDLVAQR